jgi:endonuclease/exonuclease/phosphatase family metal-dependent hydrolase
MRAVLGDELITHRPPIVGNRPPHSGSFPLRVVAFNAHGGRHLEAIAACLSAPPLAGADIVFLCEAGWGIQMSGHGEFARELADRMGMSFAYAPEFRLPGDGSATSTRSIGNAILARGRLENVNVVPLTRFHRQKLAHLIGRPLGLTATIERDGLKITVGVVHLDSRTDPAGRALQMSEFISALPEVGPTIIGGDLNTTTVGLHGREQAVKALTRFILAPRRLRQPQSYEPLFDLIARRGFSIDDANVAGASTFTISGLVPRILRPKLDWIALRGVRAVAGSAVVVAPRLSAVGRRFSDHDFIACSIIPGR